MSIRVSLIKLLGGVDTVTYLEECDRHTVTQRKLSAEQDALEQANLQLSTMHKEYVAYQDKQQAKEADAVVAYRELLIAVMKANLQKAKGSAWKLNQLTRYPNKIADVIRAEFRRHYPEPEDGS